MKRLKNILHSNKGQAVVETALVLPALLLVLCGIVDFGWILGNKLLLSYCSREGTRYGIVVASDTDCVNQITQRVMDVAPSYIKNALTVDVAFTDPCDRQDGDVSVDVSCNINVLTPLGQIITHSPTVALHSDCIMKAE